MLCLLVLLSVLQKKIQTDWMGSSGVQGPVTNWGTQYYQSDSITTANEGQVSLVATSWDYTSSGWTKHVIESNSGISNGFQGFTPADINNDGIMELVALSADSVIWYKRIGSNYDNWTKNIVGPAITGYCIWPYDLDKDSDIDILVVNTGGGIGWYENLSNGTGWQYYSLENTTAYHRVCAADVDLDGDIDVIAVDNNPSHGDRGNIQLFRNDGTMHFTKEAITNFAGYEAWRVYPADFNNDGEPDIYSVYDNTYVFLNDGTGHFNQSFSADYWSGGDFDGAWAEDINMDGKMDLVCGGFCPGSSYAFHALLNDGTGYNFVRQLLNGTQSSYYIYSDGAISKDIDLDGFPDIAGTYSRVGWFRQNPSNPLNFTLYDIGVLTNSHWIYAAPLGNKCIPSIDLMVTDKGEHIVYENQMLKAFASYGWLTSSILELASQNRKLQYFGWDACLPSSSTLAFWWRADTSVSGINGQSWNGPYYATKNIDSVVLPQTSCEHYFQYKVEFKPNTTPLDIAVLYEVWVSHDTCTGAAYVEGAEIFNNFNLQVIDDKILLSSPMPYDNVTLSIYNISGGLVQTLYKGSLEAQTYVFVPKLQAKGVYMVVLKWLGGEATTKLIKLK